MPDASSFFSRAGSRPTSRARVAVCRALWGLAGVLPGALAAAGPTPDERAPVVVLGHFDAGWRESWRERRFAARPTIYTVDVDETGRACLRGSSEGASSGLWRGVEGVRPVGARLSWRWRIEAPVDNTLGERTRLGDDYAARVWVIFESSWRPRAIRALCYVWAAHEPAGEMYANPFSDQVGVIVVRSGPGEAGRWQEESRDLGADYEAYFGVRARRLDAVGVMVDSDNTGRRATSWFADLTLWPTNPGATRSGAMASSLSGPRGVSRGP